MAFDNDDLSATTRTKAIVPAILDGFLRREELAEQLGLSTRTIDRWEAMQQGPPRVSIGRTILYNVDSVREWLRAREQRPITPRTRRRSTSDIRGAKARKAA